MHLLCNLCACTRASSLCITLSRFVVRVCVSFMCDGWDSNSIGYSIGLCAIVLLCACFFEFDSLISLPLAHKRRLADSCTNSLVNSASCWKWLKRLCLPLTLATKVCTRTLTTSRARTYAHYTLTFNKPPVTRSKVGSNLLMRETQNGAIDWWCFVILKPRAHTQSRSRTFH